MSCKCEKCGGQHLTRHHKPQPVTDANEVLCLILELKTININGESMLKYSEVLDAFAATR